MSTLTGRLRLTLHQICCWLVALVPSVLLMGCGSRETPRPVLSQRCMQVGGTHETTLSVASPYDGFLRLRVEERGISVIAAFDGDPASAAESPVERLGTIDLLVPARRGSQHSITIKANDSPDITGDFCVRADSIAASDKARVSAETALATAGRSTHGHDWNAAYEEYLNAARQFDRLHARHMSGATRHAMAEIAYLRFDRQRDSYALASQALADYGERADPLIAGALVALQSKTLFDIPETDVRVIAPKMRELLKAARKSLQTTRFGTRELPRLQIMEGFLDYRLNARASARLDFAAAAQQCRRMHDWDCYALATQNLAALASESKNLTDALLDFEDALKHLPPELDTKLAAGIWSNYGSIQGRVGLFSSSQRSYAMAMRGFAQLGDCEGVRRVVELSGTLMVQLGSLSDAKHELQQAVSLECADLLAVGTDDARPETVRSGHASTVAAREYANALGPDTAWCSQLLEPLGLVTEEKLVVLNSLVSLSHALTLEGDTALARQCLDAAEPYAATGRRQMRLANARGEVLLDSQEATAARGAFERAMRIADEAKIPPGHEFRGAAQLGIAKSALLAGDAQRAVRDGLAVMAASVSRGDIDQTVASLRVVAAGYRGSKRPEQAVRTLQTAVDLIETVPIDELDGEKRATYLATQYSVFAELTDLYASSVDTKSSLAATAFVTSERGRARSLRYATTQSEDDVPVTPDSFPAERYRQLLHNVVSLTEAHPGTAQETLVEELDKAALGERRSEDPFDQQRLLQALGKLHATLIEYAAGTHDMFAFVVNDGGIHVIRLGDRQKISSAAAELNQRLLDSEAPQSEIRATARRLAALVLWPLTGQISGERLLFVPDEGLHTIPFNVLPWSAEASDLLVLQHAEVSIVPSALFLTRSRANVAQHSSAPRVELLGDPVFRVSDWHQECTDAVNARAVARPARSISDWTESLPRLPGTRAEVQMIARLSQQSRPSTHIEILLGCAAVPSALRRAASGNVDLLHIATHARVDAQRPRLSALALTPERTADSTASAFGLLDILGLNLSSTLVVLSACETSGGRLLPGEGVLGPAQAFLQAGAGAVVASYWRVDDLTTSKFMQRFYKYLLSDRLPAATALRRAQMDEAQTSSTHNWAAFSLYGWPDSSI